jgi:hypothetical protein
MFTFHWSELLVVVVFGLVLLLGLALLMLRRLKELLEKFLTPEDPDIDLYEAFFKPRPPKPVEDSSEETDSTESSEAEKAPGEETARWGTPTDG